VRPLLAIAVALATAVAAPDASGSLPAPPKGWPGKLELGLASQPGTAGAILREAPFGFRYQYLAGDVRDQSGWQNWNANGRFVSNYVAESRRHAIAPVFSWYVLQHSRPAGGSSERDAVRANLADRGFVRAWLENLELALQRIGDRRAVIQIEPDFWGYVQQIHGDRAPRQVRRLARRMIELRNRVAPRVLLAYHVSIWGTNTDIVLQDSSRDEVRRLATRAARFYRSLGTRFDLVFGEMDDRDAGYNEVASGDGGASWWNRADYRRHVRFFARFVQVARRRVVIWQIPVGSSGLDNTYQRYRDNKVETLLRDPDRRWLKRYVRAGVIGFLFGAGADAATSPEADGGFFYESAARYYRRGRLKLP
jgi:hypothetical protein